MDERRVVEILASGVAAVESANVPEELREAAFTTALNLLASQGRTAAPVSSPAAGSAPSRGPSPGPAGTGSQILDSIAEGLELDARGAQTLYAEKNGAPELILKASKLPKAKATATHDIALLVMAARQLSGVDDYTEAQVLREAAKRYGKFDQSNFGQHMRALDNLIITDGKGASAKRKLTQPGLERAAELANAYLSED